MKTALRYKNIWQLILMARKNELKKALAMITNWKLSDVKEFMAINLVDKWKEMKKVLKMKILQQRFYILRG